MFKCFAKLKFIFFFIYLMVITTSLASGLSTSEKIEQALEMLQNLTCETSGFANLLGTEFAHTCNPAPFFDAAIANILSPGIYATALLKLKINDKDLFPGSCNIENRLDYNNPVLTFAFCKNYKLFAATASAAASGYVAMLEAIIAGKNVEEAVARNLSMINKADYHDFYSAKPGDQGVFEDVSIIPVIPWKIVKKLDQVCLATAGITGWLNVGCKYIKEPFPSSKYDLHPELTGGMNCNSLGTSCITRSRMHSANMTTISGPIVFCAREMITRLFINPNYCAETHDTPITVGSDQNIFYNFQKNMHRAVAAFLTLYVIFTGFQIILANDVPDKKTLASFVLKVILVAYFSIGINSDYVNNGFDGITSWVFPILFEGANQIAGWFLNATSSDLCRFDASDYSNDISTKGFYALWDALDCRVMHYLGLNFLSDSGYAEGFLNFSIPPYLILVIPAVITGNFKLAFLALSYPILVLSIAAYFVNTFVISLICIVILGVLAPIFVPMVLFEYTKELFMSWFKLMVSLTIQPVVIAVFLTIMFSVYDNAFYTSCKYNTLRLTMHDGAEKKVFILNTNIKDYVDDEFGKCATSIGGMINFPLAFRINAGLEAIGAQNTDGEVISTFSAIKDIKIEDLLNAFPFLKGLNPQKGLFIETFDVIIEFIKDFIWKILIACLILYLMYHFSNQLSQFSADMAEGISLQSSTIAPLTVFNAVKAGMGKMDGGDGQAMDKISASGSDASSDKLSVGRASINNQVASQVTQKTDKDKDE